MSRNTDTSIHDGWDTWTVEDLTKELLDRLRYFYAQTDGMMRFPPNAEGDMLKLAHVLCRKLQDA